MIPIKKILDAIRHLDYVGDKGIVINSPVQATAEKILKTHILWISDKNASLLPNILTGTVICSDKIDRATFRQGCNYLIVENPRSTFQQILETFFTLKEPVYISSHSHIDQSVVLGKDVTIGHGVVIEADCSVGDFSIIGHNTVIKKNTLIGKSVKIGSNCTIGGVGFGYEKNEEGQYKFIPHLGNVVIKDNAEVGNCTAIDRAVMGSTLIGVNCKIDNLVHIAHGVQLGNNTLVIANAMIAGSVIVGENVWVAPSSSILNNKSIGDNAVIGMGAVVLKNVEAGNVVVGNPGKVLSKP